MNKLALVFAAALLIPAQSMAADKKPAAAAQPSAAASSDPKIKFKDGNRYLRDLSASLDLPRATICKELGQYDCFNDAFRIVLGGVEAENLAVFTPQEEEALTTPIALDRVALHVCVNRVQLDLAQPGSAVLLRNAPKGKASPEWVKTTTATLYDRILNREPTASEGAELANFYKTVSRKGGRSNPDATKDWVTLGCFALASSIENIYY